MTPDPQSPEPGGEEQMLCPSCLEPNDPDTKYCRGCGAPIGPTAALGPWEQTQAQGFAIRQATTSERPRFILVLGVWLIFFPTALGSALLLFMTVKDSTWQVGEKLWMVAWLGGLVLSVALIWRSTTNYFARKTGRKDESAA